jgi:glycosyltransferase involved in cell wall biosynthesis
LLYVVNHAGFFVSHRLPLALAAIDAGYEVHVASPRSKHVPLLLQLPGITWHQLPLTRSGVNPLREFRAFVAICRLYRRVKPTVVHHVTSKPVLYGTLAARVTGVPAVVNAVAGLGHMYTQGGVPRRLLRQLISAGYRVALRHPAMRVIIQNRDDLARFVGNSWVRSEDAVLIPGSGVDVTQFAPRERAPAAAVQIVLASRLLYTKGVAEFVEAARDLQSRGLAVRCVLVGEPDADNPASVPLDVLQRWHAAGVIEYRGRTENMPAVYAETDIVCLPTYYGEGVPKGLIEAAACGLPIVTTDWPGCRDIVTDGENGLLVPPRDARALADALAALAVNPELRLRMGQRGRSRVVGVFCLDTVVRKTLALYAELSHAH